LIPGRRVASLKTPVGDEEDSCRGDIHERRAIARCFVFGLQRRSGPSTQSARSPAVVASGIL
jgi:hypothetical protein